MPDYPELQLVRLARAGRFFRLAKVPHVTRITDLFTAVADTLEPRTLIVISVIRQLAILVTICHFLACLWFGLTDVDDEDSWV